MNPSRPALRRIARRRAISAGRAASTGREGTGARVIEQRSVVHVIDDDPSFIKAIVRLLRASGFEVAPYSSARQFLDRESRDGPGCVITDLCMPGMDGLALQKELAESGNPLPVVFLSGNADVPHAVSAMREGASDFLTKRADLGQLMGAVTRALERDEERRTAESRKVELRANFDTLTARERQVLAEVLRGRLNKQIADTLEIHERTVKLHRTSLTTKLGVRSAAQLARLAQEADLWLELTQGS